MSTGMHEIKVQRGVLPQYGTETIKYRCRGGTWFVKEEGGEWREFADDELDDVDVRKKIKEEFDARY